jgi:hypothetical protein
VNKLTEDKIIEHTKVVELDPDVISKFSDDYTIMDNFDIKQGLIETITDFQTKVKEQITPQDALRLGRTTYASTQKLDEKVITKLIHEVINESKNSFEVYHKSYTSAVNAGLEYTEKRGYTYSQDEVADKIGMGPKKPSEGETNRFSIELKKDGNEQKKMLHMQIYNMGEKYELNAYIN